MKSIRYERIAPFFLLTIFLLLSVLSIRDESITYDEPQHFRYGAMLLLEHNSNRFDDSKMPVSAWNALPRAMAIGIQRLTNADRPPEFLFDMKTGRYMTILAGLLLGVFIYRWSSELYGPNAGLFSLFLFALSPNLIAHAGLVTTDLYAATSITIALYYYWHFLRCGTNRAGLKSAATLAIAQITKYSSVFLFPIFLLLAAVHFYPRLRGQIASRDWSALRNDIGRTALWLVVFVLIMILILNIAYLFNQTFTPFGDYRFRSGFFQQIQAQASFLAKFPIPIPYPYLEGLDWVKQVDSALRNNIYLLGEIRRDGEKYIGYYLVAYLFKEPIAHQLFLLLAMTLMPSRLTWEGFRQNQAFLLLPIGFFIFYFSVLFNTQIGIRYILVILPLLYVLCGEIFSRPPARFLGWSIGILAVYLLASVISYFPNYISYFNELVWDRKKAYKVLADSNIEWGQNEFYVETYRQENPDVLPHPIQPTSGRILVDVNFLTGVFPKSNLAWLRENFEPIDHVAQGYLLFDVSPEQFRRLLETQPHTFPSPLEVINPTDDYYALHWWHGHNLEGQGQYREALLHYHRVAEYVPWDPAPRQRLAKIHQVLGNLDPAAENRAAAAHLREMEALYGRGLQTNAAKDFQTAHDIFARITEQEPDYKLAMFYQGLMLQMLDRHTEAVPLYRRFQDRFPAYHQNLFNLAYALMRIGKCDQAIPLFERTLVLKPDYQAAKLHLGHCTNLEQGS